MKDFNTIFKDLKNKVYYPVYLLQGEESYFIDEITNYIEKNVLTAQEKEFNLSVLYGKDIDITGLVATCKRYPMVSNYQVVIVREAQSLRDIDKLASYVEKPLKSTLLVLCHKHGKLDGRKALSKLVDKTGVLFDSPRIYDNKVAGWITEYLGHLGYSIQQKAAQLMADYLGNDLSKVVNELGKLIINLPGNTSITPELVEQNIGISKDFNVFELQRALGASDVLKANQIIKYFAENEKDNPLIKIIPILHLYFTRIFIYHHVKDKSQNSLAAAMGVKPTLVYEYSAAAARYSPDRIRKIFGILRDFDLRIKGVTAVNTDDGELMKEMIFKILH